MLKPMIAIAGLAGVLACGGAALAQVPPAEIGARNVPAPWWMATPVIASLGRVRTELPANRASFEATFTGLDKTAERAQAAAGEKVREIDAALRKVGADRLAITTQFETKPLYEQYRDKDGNFQDNERPDKIERYAATATVSIEVRDVAVLEAAYNAVLAARPESIGSVDFDLQPDNATKAWLQTEAVKDAANRARQAATAAGAHLGSVRIIDPTARVCRTDVLAGWPSYGAPPPATDVARGMMAMEAMSAPAPQVMVTGAVAKRPPPPVVTLQPPLEELTDEACVVYALLP
ncbi:hypothetical protein IP88_14865 [alpha proteobacterium AAP81b]|nr:hypothetical protein IP88_14865 [alpha proteobacterium AAP81b]